jgi:hypothetical protein
MNIEMNEKEIVCTYVCRYYCKTSCGHVPYPYLTHNKTGSFNADLPNAPFWRKVTSVGRGFIIFIRNVDEYLLYWRVGFYVIFTSVKKKSKAILVTGREGP